MLQAGQHLELKYLRAFRTESGSLTDLGVYLAWVEQSDLKSRVDMLIVNANVCFKGTWLVDQGLGYQLPREHQHAVVGQE